MIDLYFIKKYAYSINEPLNKKHTGNNNLCMIGQIFIFIVSLYIYNLCNENHSFEFIPAILFPVMYILYNTLARQGCLKMNLKSGDKSSDISISGSDIPDVNQVGGNINSDTISSIGY